MDFYVQGPRVCVRPCGQGGAARRQLPLSPAPARPLARLLSARRRSGHTFGEAQCCASSTRTCVAAAPALPVACESCPALPPTVFLAASASVSLGDVLPGEILELHIRVIEAKELRNTQRIGSMDPYVK